jgi:DNA polymerase (family 10)
VRAHFITTPDFERVVLVILGNFDTIPFSFLFSMPQVNKELSNIFSTMADLLEIRGEASDFYRIRAYRAAALAIVSESADVLAMTPKELDRIHGVGSAIAEKIMEYKETGKIQAFVKLKKSLPSGLPKLLAIEGLGPKHTKLFWKRLGITTIPKLRTALKSGKIAKLPGFGERSAAKLLAAIAGTATSERLPREKVLPVAKGIYKAIAKLSCVSDALIGGSLRRGKDTVLVSSKNPARCAGEIAALPLWERMIGRGETKVSGIVRGIQCDVRLVEEKSFGSASVYFTGSKGFNIYLRKIAIAKNLKLNEYGLFNARGKMIAGETEESVFQALGIKYLTPKQRDAF